MELPGTLMCARHGTAGIFLPTQLGLFLCCLDLRLSMWDLLEGTQPSFTSGGTCTLTPFKLSVRAGLGVMKPSGESRPEKQIQYLSSLNPLGNGKVWSRRFETAEIPEAGHWSSWKKA